MARKRKHEEHAAHEAWAIPYGDLITLLLAFFVVMYAISAVNEGKYRVLSNSLSEAFGGAPKAIRPIQIGKNEPAGGFSDDSKLRVSGAKGPITPIPLRNWTHLPRLSRQLTEGFEKPLVAADRQRVAQAQEQLREISDKVETQLKELIDRGLVDVEEHEFWVEVTIKSDILFASGIADPNAAAVRVLNTLADTLVSAPNAMRVEGHTDNRPIRTTQFPSNWELSSARAGSVVRIFESRRIAPARLSLVGFGEQRPIADNGTAEGRNANRRVVVVILADLGETPPVDDTTPPVLPQALTYPEG